MPIVQFNVKGQPTSLGWIIAFLVLIACLVVWLAGAITPSLLLGLIAGLALAYVIG